MTTCHMKQIQAVGAKIVTPTPLPKPSLFLPFHTIPLNFSAFEAKSSRWKSLPKASVALRGINLHLNLVLQYVKTLDKLELKTYHPMGGVLANPLSSPVVTCRIPSKNNIIMTLCCNN